VPGGDFESAAGPWTLAGGAATIPGNEPYHVRLGSDATSLLLPAGASATASNVCFGLLNPGIRFFAAGVGGPATLHVEIVTRSLLGLLSVLDGGTVTVAPGWAPTPVFSTAGSQLAMLAGAKTIQLRISTVSGNAQIDDVYVDPFCSR
ncbi:MAG TPA: hypothetical protein VLV28_07220, partial [Gaiellaceae bacterium]|nr:hypothetical protein [Gaiellaceae bacterium]